MLPIGLEKGFAKLLDGTAFRVHCEDPVRRSEGTDMTYSPFVIHPNVYGLGTLSLSFCAFDFLEVIADLHAHVEFAAVQELVEIAPGVELTVEH